MVSSPRPAAWLQCGRFRLSLARPLVMGVVNLTPDSFSGDGLGGDPSAALRHAERLLDEGADMLDVGAESSRPGAAPIADDEELRRLGPVVDRLVRWGVPISIDTCKPRVMRAMLDAGADMINDILAFRAPGAVEAVASGQAALCVMHMRGSPQSMQADPRYGDVVADVRAFLHERVESLLARGIARERLVADPGFGFGKRLPHNLELLKDLADFADLHVPVLVGMSRKSMLGQMTGRPVGERSAATVAAGLVAVLAGATLVRVHEAAPMRDALAVLAALRSMEQEKRGSNS